MTEEGFFYEWEFTSQLYNNKRTYLYPCICNREEIPSSQALQILKQFASEIPGTIRQTRRYRIRKTEKNCSDTIDRSSPNYLINKNYTRMKS